MSTISVVIEGGTRRECPVNTEVGTLAALQKPAAALPYVGALVNNDLCSMSYPLTVNSTVRFLTMADPHGWRVYRRSLCFLLAKAVRDVYPEAQFAVEHSFGLGLYCSFSLTGAADAGIRPEHLARLDARMRELVARDVPIERRKIAYADAVRQFEAAGQTDKLNLLRHRNPPRVVVHWCDGFSDLAHGPLAPSAGVLARFQLLPYPPGFVLHLPDRDRPQDIPPFEDQPHLFQIFQEHREWGRILGVTTVGKLNEIVAAGDVDELIRTAEALHEKKAVKIADQIAGQRGRLKLILIAGPSSSGKTTFAKRLTSQLRVNGLRTVTIATDDYFVGPEDNPRDEDGNPDFEHLEAIDLELFNRQLLQLVHGEEVDIPTYNFETRRREWRGVRRRVEEDQVLIVEGIHGLNPRLTHRVPGDCKFRIYVSALTQLKLDANNRISTTDNRLMRRMVRDHQYRGHPALETLRLWPGVRRGERRWIFPFQREADATFNSALDYELAVLKPLVEPLLMQVKPTDTEYAEARRLSEFLLNFLAAPAGAVPGNSILREYIGHSTFHY